MTRFSIAGALLSALALSVIPSTAGAAADPEPPNACASTTGYSTDGSFRGELTVCMTKYRKYSSSLGREWMSPTATVTARCYHKTLLTWSEQQSCKWNAWLTMKKDGNQAWHEHWSDQTEATHQGAVTKYEYYQCRGNGIYSLTIDDINMKSSNNGIVDHWTSVYPKAVTATGKGC